MPTKPRAAKLSGPPINSVCADVEELVTAFVREHWPRALERTELPEEVRRAMRSLDKAALEVRLSMIGEGGDAAVRCSVYELVVHSLVWLALDEMKRGEGVVAAEFDALLADKGVIHIPLPAVPKAFENTVIRHGNRRFKGVEQGPLLAALNRSQLAAEAPRVGKRGRPGLGLNALQQERAARAKPSGCAVHGQHTQPDPRNSDCTCDINRPWEDEMFKREQADILKRRARR
jgi:hypothetical protein